MVPDGLDSTGLALIKAHADTAEYWDASTSTVKQLLGMWRAIRHDDADEFPADNPPLRALSLAHQIRRLGAAEPAA